MYRPDASADDLAEYERLVGAGRLVAPPLAAEAPAARTAVTDPAPTSRSRPSRTQRIALVLGVAAVIAGLVVAVVLQQRDPPFPQQLDAPAASGRTLTILFRASDPRIAPGVVTYQPQGYQVFQPTARTLHVAIRCQGAGRVVIAVGAVFTFRCTERRAVLRQTLEASGRPFVAVGTTRGNVVWSARVTTD
ncbi:hypothetical protein [uncultured Amnibacterium sp.]|uniref:hypothetical protein n=1 Tax=uncultured Amnibacterium sp. TaxID=1631851 RepID=UPI0035CACD37